MKRFSLPVSLLLMVFSLSTSAHAGDPMRKMAREINKKLQGLKNPRVAILTFPYHNGRISSGSSILSERLTTYLAELKGVRVIERSLLKKLLEEQHLSESGVVDAAEARKIGQVAGVDAIISGTLNDLEGKQTELNVRALKAGSGEVLAASRAVVARIWADNPRAPQQTAFSTTPPEEENPEANVPNEAIEIGFPGGRGGGKGYGGMGGR